jgi:hypothetical protein
VSVSRLASTWVAPLTARRRLLDWLRSPSLSVQLAKYVPFFWPGVDDEEVAHFLAGAPREFVASLTRPGLVHSLPPAVASLLLPSGAVEAEPAQVARRLSFDLPTSPAVRRGTPIDELAPLSPAGQILPAAHDDDDDDDEPPSMPVVSLTPQQVRIPRRLLPTKAAQWASGFVSSLSREWFARSVVRNVDAVAAVAPSVKTAGLGLGAVVLVMLLTSKAARKDTWKMVRQTATRVPLALCVVLLLVGFAGERWPAMREQAVKALRGEPTRWDRLAAHLQNSMSQTEHDNHT